MKPLTGLALVLALSVAAPALAQEKPVLTKPLVTSQLKPGNAAPAAGAEADSPAAESGLAAALPEQQEGEAATAGGFLAQQQPGDLLSTDVVGQPLFDTAGAELGQIDDVLIGGDRRLAAVVVRVGAEPDAKRVAIPFDALEWTIDDEGQLRLVTGIEQAALETAPAFEALSAEASLDDNQDLTEGPASAAEGGSTAPIQ